MRRTLPIPLLIAHPPRPFSIRSRGTAKQSGRFKSDVGAPRHGDCHPISPSPRLRGEGQGEGEINVGAQHAAPSLV